MPYSVTSNLSPVTYNLAMTKLGVNIDHIATLREARKTNEPDPVAAAVIAELAGCHGITVHLRSDRRHIQDRDVELLRETVKTRLNLEMAATEEMIRFAREIKPDTVTLVPELPGELTTQGGLDCVRNYDMVSAAAQELEAAGIAVSLFIDPEKQQIEAAQRIGVSDHRNQHRELRRCVALSHAKDRSRSR